MSFLRKSIFRHIGVGVYVAIFRCFPLEKHSPGEHLLPGKCFSGGGVCLKSEKLIFDIKTGCKCTSELKKSEFRHTDFPRYPPGVYVPEHGEGKRKPLLSVW